MSTFCDPSLATVMYGIAGLLSHLFFVCFEIGETRPSGFAMHNEELLTGRPAAVSQERASGSSLWRASEECQRSRDEILTSYRRDLAPPRRGLNMHRVLT